MKPFMRIVLDEKVDDPDPVAPGEQATAVGHDGAGNFMVSWDNGRRLSLIPDVDKYHVVGSEDELQKSFEWLKRMQEGTVDSKCPRCGKPFDVHKGDISRQVKVRICDKCVQQETVTEPLNDWYVVKIWQGLKN